MNPVLSAGVALFLAAARYAVAASDPAPFRAAVGSVQQAAHRHPDRSSAYFEELERGFRGLQSRFPDEAEVYAELLFVADHRGSPAGDALARQILAWPAPAVVKEKAEGVLKKRAALGRPCDLEFATADGHRFRLADHRGKVVLVDFWATWCPPCREKLPELLKLHDRHHADGFEIIGVCFDEDLTKLRRFVTAEKIPWLQSADGRGWAESPLARTCGLTSLPAMWLVDRQGRLRDLDARDDLPAKLGRLLSEER